MSKNVKYDPVTGLPIQDDPVDNLAGTKRANAAPYQAIPSTDPKAGVGTAEGGTNPVIQPGQPSNKSTLNRLTGNTPANTTPPRVSAPAPAPASTMPSGSSQFVDPSGSSAPDDYSGFSFSEFLKKVKKEEDDPKELRRRRAKLGLAALSDILASVGNLYATTQGAASANAPSSVAALNKRFADLDKQRDAELWRRYAAYTQEGQERYRRHRDQKADQERAEAIARDEKRRAEDNATRERWRAEDNAARERWRQEDVEYRNKRAAQQDKQFEAQRKQAQQQLALQSQKIKDYGDEKVKAVLRGKRLPFQKEDGGVINIYENAWKHNWEQVWDAIANSSWAKRSENLRQLRRLKTTRDKQSFVQQNWNKIDDAISAMEKLSQYDPAIDYDNDSSGSGSDAPWTTSKNNDSYAPWAKH